MYMPQVANGVSFCLEDCYPCRPAPSSNMQICHWLRNMTKYRSVFKNFSLRWLSATKWQQQITTNQKHF